MDSSEQEADRDDYERALGRFTGVLEGWSGEATPLFVPDWVKVAAVLW